MPGLDSEWMALGEIPEIALRLDFDCPFEN